MWKLDIKIVTNFLDNFLVYRAVGVMMVQPDNTGSVCVCMHNDQ